MPPKLLTNQKTISTRNFLTNFSKISKLKENESPIYFLIIRNGEEAGIYIPFNKIESFIKLHSALDFYDKRTSPLFEGKPVSLEESYQQINFEGDKDLSKNYKKILYNK